MNRMIIVLWRFEKIANFKTCPETDIKYLIEKKPESESICYIQYTEDYDDAVKTVDTFKTFMNRLQNENVNTNYELFVHKKPQTLVETWQRMNLTNCQIDVFGGDEESEIYNLPRIQRDM